MTKNIDEEKCIAAIRSRTGCSHLEAKRALIESRYHKEAAIDYIRQHSLIGPRKIKINKKFGKIFSYSSDAGCSMIELSCESDFIECSKEFKDFGDYAAKICCEKNLEEPSELKKLIESEWTAINNLLGEKINIVRCTSYAKQEEYQCKKD
jgi:translation elongation factor EF-Ts